MARSRAEYPYSVYDDDILKHFSCLPMGVEDWRHKLNLCCTAACIRWYCLVKFVWSVVKDPVHLNLSLIFVKVCRYSCVQSCSANGIVAI
jgi:hypothetical protein